MAKQYLDTSNVRRVTDTVVYNNTYNFYHGFYAGISPAWVYAKWTVWIIPAGESTARLGFVVMAIDYSAAERIACAVIASDDFPVRTTLSAIYPAEPTGITSTPALRSADPRNSNQETK